MKKAFLYIVGFIFAAGLIFGGTISDVKLSGNSPYCIGENVTISWVATGVNQKIKIQLVKTGGGYADLIATNLAAAAGSYVWGAGQNQGGSASPGDNYRIRISTLDNSIANKSSSFELKNCVINPDILKRLRQIRIMVKWPPEPDPCLCPEFDLRKIRELLGDLKGNHKLGLFKNGVLVQELGVFNRRNAMPNSLKPRLGAENYGLLTKGGVTFSLGLIGADGKLLNEFALEGAAEGATLR